MEVKAGLARVALARNDMKDALHQANEIAAYLADGGSLRGTWEPLRIYLTCYQVFQSAQDPRAEEILTTAYNLLQDQAARIPDQAYRVLFLEHVPWHREVTQAWQARVH